MNLTSKHKYMHMSMLSLCVYNDLYGWKVCIGKGTKTFILRPSRDIHLNGGLYIRLIYHYYASQILLTRFTSLNYSETNKHKLKR